MKKGVSLVSLVIVIIVMIIIAGIVITSGNDAIELGNINMFAAEILNIQTAVDKYNFEQAQYPVGNNIILDISSMTQSEKNQFSGETITDNKVQLATIDMNKIGITDIQYGNSKTDNDIYTVSINTGKVYYLSGVEYKNVIYYTLSEDLYNIANIAPSSNVTSNDIKKLDVVFSPSTKDYTNEPVSVTVKIPKEAIATVTASDSKIVSTESIQGINKIITVNSTGNAETRTGNYVITVSYVYKGLSKEVSYEVANFDNTAPEIENVTSNIDGNLRTITFAVKEDESGIKNIKYEIGNEEKNLDSAYFANSGKQVTNNTIIIDSTKTCTIYVQDKAGNNNVYKAVENATY